MGNKIIFVDIDGTLVAPGTNVPPESALKAIKSAQKKGNKVFLCSGRNYDMLKPLLKYGFDGIVASAGGYVMIGDDLIYDCPMTNEQRDIAIKALHKHGVFCTLEAASGSWGDSDLKDFIAEQGEGNSEIERWRKALAEDLHIRPFEEYDGTPIYKIVVMCREMSQLDEAKELLKDDFNFVMQIVPLHGNCVNGELINYKFNKGTGVKLVAEKLGIPIEDTYGFGDSMNDLEMIEAVGTSVCMENGAAPLKEISDIVCPAVDDDGLAAAFEQLNLS